MMSVLVPGLLATSVLIMTGLKQLTAFQRGEIRDLQAMLLGLLGFLLCFLLQSWFLDCSRMADGPQLA